MADTLRLINLPSDFGEYFLPYKTSLRQRVQAKKFANESYISSVKLYRAGNGGVVVKAVVFRNQRKNDNDHRIDIVIGQQQITDAFCSCKAGASGECAHVLAVVLKLTYWILEDLSDVPSQPACTSMPQRWDKPRGVRIEPKPVSTMVIAKPGNSNRKKRPLTADFQDNGKIQVLGSDIECLQSLNRNPIAYLACQPLTEHGTQNVGSAFGLSVAAVAAGWTLAGKYTMWRTYISMQIRNHKCATSRREQLITG